MIFGIGTDIVQVSRIRSSLERFGERFAARILTEAELAQYRRSGQPAHFLAKRFAAKEAAAKAIGLGFRDGLTLHDIAVGHDPYGRPLLEFSASATDLLRRLGAGEAHLSLSDERDYAVAFVTLMRAEHPGTPKGRP